MKTLKSFQLIMAFLLAILLAAPPVVLAQDGKAAAAKRFSQEELDQILAPVALYPDSLLAQVLMSSTYPLEVVMADRWVKQNKNLTGDKLIEAADNRRVSRTFEDTMARRTAATNADAATRTGIAGNVGRTSIGVSNASIDRGGSPEASVSRRRPDNLAFS